MTSVSTFIKQIISKNSILSNFFENNTHNDNLNINNYDIEEARFKIHPISGELFYKTIFQTKNSYFIFNSINLSKENGEKHFIGVMDPETKVMMDYFYYKNGNNYYITASVNFRIIYREINPDIEDIKSMIRNIERYYLSRLSSGTNKVFNGSLV
jgi:hypothetical protein